MADMFTITTIEKLPERLTNANFIMVGKNGGEKGFSADEKTKEIFAKVLEDILKFADLKRLGTVFTYTLDVQLAEVTIVADSGKRQTFSLYELDDHANLDALRAQLREKGHEFDCSHSFAQSCNIHIKEIEKEDPSKLKFWKSRSKKNDEKIKKLEVARDGQ